MDALGFIITICFWIVGALWGTAVVIFWIVVVLVAATFVAVLFNRAATRAAQPTIDPVRAVRDALRRGDLDADLARVDMRNRQRVARR